MHIRKISVVLICLAFLLFPMLYATAQNIKVEDIKVDNIKVKSGRPYKIGDDGLDIGTVYYIDRTFIVSAMPKEMIGATFIMTANDDKASLGADFLTFTVKSPVVVWIARDSRGEPVKGGQVPEWQSEKQGWIRHEDLKIEVTDTNMGNFILWSKEFPKSGDIVLGGNTDPPAAGQGSMYLVLLTSGGKMAVESSGKLGVKWAEIKSIID